MTEPLTLRTGRKKNDPSRRRISLTAAPSSYTPPATLDYYSKVSAALWGMDGNDNAGDCTCADVDHEIKSDQSVAGNPLVGSTTAEVLHAYTAITGYDPNDPSTDQGAEMQAVRDYWRKTGFTLGGKPHKILMFAELAATNIVLIKWFLDRCGTVGLGINFPDSAMTQFNAGQPWDVVEGEPEPTEGHAIALVGWDAQYAYILTWGRVQKMTWAFFAKYVEEVWGGLSEDFVNTKSGTDEFGETLFQLGAQFGSITGKANPVPAPSPSPSPAPPPFPVPTPTPSPHPDVDQALWAELKPWTKMWHAGSNHDAAQAVIAWALTKNYAVGPHEPEHLAR